MVVATPSALPHSNNPTYAGGEFLHRFSYSVIARRPGAKLGKRLSED